MQNEMAALRDATSRLDQARVEYMLTGSLAMAFYAEPDFANDVDLIIALEPRQVEGFIAGFREGYYPLKALNPRDCFRHGAISLIHEASNVRFNFITIKDDEKIVFSRRVSFSLPGFLVWVEHREDLFPAWPEYYRNGLISQTGAPVASARVLRFRVMRMTPAERLEMASGMNDLAREIILASLPPDLPEAERRYRLFVRMHGAEFEPLARKAYLEARPSR